MGIDSDMQHPLRSYLEAKGLTQNAFAKMVRVSPACLSRVLGGKRRRVNPDACVRIAAATGGAVSLETLLSWRPLPADDSSSARRTSAGAR